MNDDRNPYPPPNRDSSDQPDEDAAPSPADEGVADNGPTVQLPSEPGDAYAADLAQRLSALDRLYETQQITATELGEARRRALSSGSDPSVPPAGAYTPPSAPPAPPAPRGTGQSPPDGQVQEKRIAGVPVWAAAVGVVVLVAAAVALILALTIGGGDDARADGGPSETASAEYLQGDVNGSLSQLTSSAVAIGKSLARTSEPRDIKALNRAASRQIELVEEARRRLSRVQVTEEFRTAHQRLVAASATQRRYLVQLVRASSGTVNQTSLRALDRVRKAGADTQAAYRSFFGLVPAAPDAITATDLTDTAGVKAAINKTITARAAAVQAERDAAAARAAAARAAASASAAPRNYSGTSFQSPTGNLRCQDYGGSLFCTSSNDGFGVVLPDYGSPSTGQYGTASGGQSVPYGSSWSSGSFRCDSESVGVTCRNNSGNGFFLSREHYRSF